jgi:hypothetical protein
MSNFRGADTPVREEEPREHEQIYSRTTQTVSTKTEQPVPADERAQTSLRRLFAFDQETLSRVTGVILLGFTILGGLIGLRFLLKLMAANPANAFADFVYTITAPFLWAFEGLTANPSFQGITIEFHDLIAIVVYAMLGWVIVRVLWLLFARVRQ